MRTCPHCRAELTRNWRFCTQCGVALSLAAEPAPASGGLSNASAATITVPSFARTSAAVGAKPAPGAEAVPSAGSVPSVGSAPSVGSKPSVGSVRSVDSAPIAGPAPAADAVPSAIRPDAAPEAARKSRVDVPLLVGIMLSGAGIVLLSYIGITLFGP